MDSNLVWWPVLLIPPPYSCSVFVSSESMICPSSFIHLLLSSLSTSHFFRTECFKQTFSLFSIFLTLFLFLLPCNSCLFYSLLFCIPREKWWGRSRWDTFGGVMSDSAALFFLVTPSLLPSSSFSFTRLPVHVHLLVTHTLTFHRLRMNGCWWWSSITSISCTQQLQPHFYFGLFLPLVLILFWEKEQEKKCESSWFVRTRISIGMEWKGPMEWKKEGCQRIESNREKDFDEESYRHLFLLKSRLSPFSLDLCHSSSSVGQPSSLNECSWSVVCNGIESSLLSCWVGLGRESDLNNKEGPGCLPVLLGSDIESVESHHKTLEN